MATVLASHTKYWTDATGEREIRSLIHILLRWCDLHLPAVSDRPVIPKALAGGSVNERLWPWDDKGSSQF